LRPQFVGVLGAQGPAWGRVWLMQSH